MRLFGLGISGDAMVTGAITGFVGLVGAFVSWRVGHRQAKADVVTAAQDAAHKVIKDLVDEIDRIKADRMGLLAQHAECQRELAAGRAETAELRAEIGELRAELADLRANAQPPLL